MRRKMNTRVAVAVGLLVISVGSSLSTYVAYTHSQQALRDSREALRAGQRERERGRQQRKLTDLHFCRAINESRRINNRDRVTFLHSRVETRRALREIKDPVLLALLKRSLTQIDRELRTRPFLKPLPCVKEIQHPTGKLPTTTSGG